MSVEGIPGGLTVQVTPTGSAVVIAAHGEIDAATAPRLQHALDEALLLAPSHLVFDLSGVEFMGSAGLSVLMIAAQPDAAREVRVVASPTARRPIEVTGLDTVLTLFDTVAAALELQEQHLAD